MHLFEIISMEPLEPYGDRKYSSIASTGLSLLFFDQAGCGATEYCTQLQYLEEHRICRSYTGVCYDDTEGCYWGCSNKSSDSIYRLSDTFREVDRLRFSDYDACFGPVRAIAYDRRDDCLLLTFANRVLAVDKRDLSTREIFRCHCGLVYQACIRSCEYHYLIGRQGSLEFLTISRNGQTVIHSCLPHGYRFLGMAEVVHCGKPILYFLSIKDGKYYFVMKGLLAEATLDGVHSPSGGQCSDPPGSSGPWGEECHSPCCEENPTVVPAPPHCHTRHRYEHRHFTHRDRHHCHKPIDCHDHGDHGGHSHDHAPRCESGASVIESIALEQTALSHILNAEGEKIQKVLAVSDQPCDFLSVNQSVLETITKITHLEQVLFAKLELACGTIKEVEKGPNQNTRNSRRPPKISGTP